MSLRNFVCRRFQNNWIEPREGAAPLHESWRIFKFFILTAVMGAAFFGQSLNYFQAVKLWMRMRNLFLSGVSAGSCFRLPPAYFWSVLQHLGDTFIQNLVCAVCKKKKKRLTLTENVGWIILGFQRRSCTTLDSYKLLFQRFFFFPEESGQSAPLRICSY